MSQPRPFRFGVSTWSAASRTEWQAKARKAEDLGFDTFLVPDHLLDGVFPPLTALCTAAEATKTLRVGTFVLNNDFRHPALVAREAATIDLLSDGRFELGIGAGHMASEYEETGFTFHAGPIRVSRLAESATILKRLLAGENVTFNGEHYQLENHHLFPSARQQPLPLLIGGNGQRVLELAAREASIVSFTGFFPAEGGRVSKLSHFTREGLEDRLAVVRAAAGTHFPSLELNTLVQAVVPGDSPRAATEAMLEHTPGLSLDDLVNSPFVLFGPPSAIAEKLLDQRDRYGVTYITVFESAMDAFAPVIVRLAGK